MSTTARRTIANNVDLHMRVLKRRYEDIVAYGKDATNDLRVAYNIYNQTMNMYRLFRKVPAYDNDPGAAALSCAVNEAVKKNLQKIEDILFRFYGINYYSALGHFGWYHTVNESLIPRDQQPELIRNFPCSICFPTKEDND
jgi:hypothetical protein